MSNCDLPAEEGRDYYLQTRGHLDENGVVLGSQISEEFISFRFLEIDPNS